MEGGDVYMYMVGINAVAVTLYSEEERFDAIQTTAGQELNASLAIHWVAIHWRETFPMKWFESKKEGDEQDVQDGDVKLCTRNVVTPCLAVTFWLL